LVGIEEIDRHAQQELDDQKDERPEELAAHLFTHLDPHSLLTVGSIAC
jgi:hypothetical protein